MPDNSDTIPIQIVNGGGDGPDLMECYFTYQDNTYTFYDKDGTEKASNLTVGSTFSFTLDEYPDLTWTLTISSGSATEVTGSWSDGPNSTNSAGGSEDQTYTAQGGTIVEEAAASATGQ